MDQRWLRVADAAKHANVSVNFIQELVRKREITTVKAGRYWLIDIVALDKYLLDLAERQHREHRANRDS